MTSGDISRSRNTRSASIVRLVIGTAVVLLAVTTIVRDLQRRSRLDEIARHWKESGIAVRHPDTFAALGREDNPQRARLGLARALLADSLDLTRLSELGPDEAAQEARRIEDRLALAAGLARSAGEVEPSSWEAPTVVGGVSLLEQLISGLDNGRDAASWEEPLRRARELSPTAIEPTRLLVAANLSRWHTLSDADRAATQTLLEATLADARSLRLLLPGWMAIASPQQLFASLPDDAQAWNQVNLELARQGRWEDYCRGRFGWQERILGDLTAAHAEADGRRLGGDVSGARRLYVQILTTSTPSLDQAMLFAKALAKLPPGPIGDRLGASFQSWLDWGLPLWLLDRPSLPPETYRRLAGYSTFLEPATVAIAELAAGELDRANALELRSDENWSEEWGLYYLAKTHTLLALGRHKDAIEAFGKVHRNHRQGSVYHRLRRELKITRADDPPPVERIQSEASWPASDWTWHGSEMSLVLDLSGNAAPAEPNARWVEIHLDEVRPDHAPVEIQWDGKIQGCWSVGEETTLRPGISVSPGLHRLVLTVPTRAQVKPGTVTLVLEHHVSAPGRREAPAKR